MDDHRRYGVSRSVVAEILDPRVDARERADRRRADSHVPVVFDHALADQLSTGHVVVVEVVEEVEQARWSIGFNGSAYPPSDGRQPSRQDWAPRRSLQRDAGAKLLPEG